MSDSIPIPGIPAAPIPSPVTHADFQEARDSYLGWCTACKAFTADCCEPDAGGYPCPDCGHNTVCGAENALMLGCIKIIDWPDESEGT